MVKIRLSGLPADVEQINQALRDSDQVIVLEESEDYANRGKSMMVRRYVMVRQRQKTMTEKTQLIRQIIISKDGQWQTVFRAPADKSMARELWVFLVENLKPGLDVEFSSCLCPDGAMSRRSGHKFDIIEYHELMSWGQP